MGLKGRGVRPCSVGDQPYGLKETTTFRKEDSSVHFLLLLPFMVLSVSPDCSEQTPDTWSHDGFRPQWEQGWGFRGSMTRAVFPG